MLAFLAVWVLVSVVGVFVLGAIIRHADRNG